MSCTFVSTPGGYFGEEFGSYWHASLHFREAIVILASIRFCGILHSSLLCFIDFLAFIRMS
jgi:hypothetical protein